MYLIFLLPFIGAVFMTILGFIWYGPLFGKTYMSLMGFQPTDTPNKKDMIIRTALEFVSGYVGLFGFLNLTQVAGAPTIWEAALFSMVFWFLLVLPGKASSAIWSGKNTKDSWKLFGIGASYTFIAFLVMGPLFVWLIEILVK